MADIDLKTSTPDTSLPTTGFLFGADSQAASAPSVYSTQTVATTLLGSTTLSGATITADAPVLNMSQTWNNSGVTFTGLKFNAATGSSAGSAAGSLLMDLQLEGTSKFSVSKAGAALASGGSLSAPGFSFKNETNTGFTWLGTGDVRLSLAGSGAYRFQADTFHIIPDASRLQLGTNLFLSRRDAANLRLGNADAASPVAQTLSVQSGTAGASATTVSISGTALTIAGTITGTIAIGHAVTGTGVSAGTLITAGSGTSWTVNNSQTVGPITAYFNSVGQNLTLTGSQGSGPSAGGSIIFQVAPAGAAATTAQNALATALTINSKQQIITANGTAAAPFLANSGDNTSGLSWASNYNLQVALGGTLVAAFGLSFFVVSDTGYIGFGSSGLNSPDTIFRRDTSNTLALRNGNNGQTFRLYGRFTDITNDFERFFIEAPTTSGAAVLLGTQKGATTGAARALTFQTDGTSRWSISTAGNLVPSANNTYDIGDGTNNPNVVYASVLAATSNLRFVASTKMAAPSDGVLNFTDSAGTNFNRLQFGGTSASFPSLKRSSASIIVRLADDTANAALESASLKTDAPAGGTAATWKLGTVASVSPTSPNRTIEVDIGGTIYYLHAKTTND